MTSHPDNLAFVLEETVIHLPNTVIKLYYLTLYLMINSSLCFSALVNKTTLHEIEECTRCLHTILCLHNRPVCGCFRLVFIPRSINK